VTRASLRLNPDIAVLTYEDRPTLLPRPFVRKAMKVIVNADDLGISESVNEAIFAAMQRGTVTSATMIANGPAVEPAANKLRLFPKCSFGVHLNLTEFQPLCPESPRDLSVILNQNGCFNGNSIRERRIGIALMRAVFREWCCQIERLMRLGVEPSHLDAHHHVHTIPQMLPVLTALRRRYKIDRIRISRNLYGLSERSSRVLLAKKRAYNFALRASGFRTTQIFTDLVTFIHRFKTERPGYGSVELMTHPGSVPGSEEAALLESDWPRQLSYDVALVSYKSL
jgi:chitin disaccharide deacetylase